MLVVDAANVVGARPDGWWRDRPGSAARLHERLEGAVTSGVLVAPVVIVLEGAARRGVDATELPSSATTVCVVHARGSGDDTIVEIVSEIVSEIIDPTAHVTVVTADRDLRRRVDALGAEVIGPRWLLDQLDDEH